MNISFIKSPNFTQGRNKYTPIAIVIHIMEGTLDGTDSWFQNPASKVSAHYGVGKNGDVHQYVLQDNTAWHAGRVNDPSWKLIKPLSVEDNTYINPNYYTVGIEHEGDEESDWTDEMYKASSELIALTASLWNIPLDRDHVIGHHEIYSLKTCPGSKVDIDKLIQMALVINAAKREENSGHIVNPLSEAGTPVSLPSQESGSSVIYNVYTKIPKSGKATTLGNVNIRSGPGVNLPVVAIVPAGIQLAYDGYVNNGVSHNNNARWYYTDEGNWFWSGAVK